MIRRPPRSTRTDTLFPTRRSSDLPARQARPGLNDGRSPTRACDAPDEERFRYGKDFESRPGRGAGDDCRRVGRDGAGARQGQEAGAAGTARSEEHTSELQTLMRISYAVLCLKKKISNNQMNTIRQP